MKELTENDIMPRRCYRAKKPAAVHRFLEPALVNDRQVLWVSSDRSLVQYDSPTVSNGRRYPQVTMEKFLKWAGSDVTSIMPKGDWALWCE
jgi:hypothetical protein